MDSIKNVPNWMIAWNSYYEGTCYYMMGKPEKAREYFGSCINVNATENVINASRNALDITGLVAFFDSWKIVTTPNIVFHFHPNTEVGNISEFVNARTNAYDSLQSFFHSSVPKKIDMFVWNKDIDYPNMQNLMLGFARPEYCVIHTSCMQTCGHELAHVISYYVSCYHRVQTKLINEGTAVRFDMTGRSLLKMAREVVGNSEVSIKKLWLSNVEFDVLGEPKAYPIAGAFVDYLIERGGRSKFIDLLSDQTYENARYKIYGKELEDIIIDFEKSLLNK